MAELLHLYLPKAPEKVSTFIGIARGERRRIQYWIHEGAPGDAQEDVESVLSGSSPRAQNFSRVTESQKFAPPPLDDVETDESNSSGRVVAPTLIVTGKVNDDGSFDLRMDTVVRDKPDAAGSPGRLNVRRTKARAKRMINNGEGKPVLTAEEKKKSREQDGQRSIERQLRLLKEMDEFGESIRMNLLEKSGLTSDRVLRDLNILEGSIEEAAHHLNADELRPALDRHFGLDNLREGQRSKQADGCTIASLLMMNAAMLHQRIAGGKWLSGVRDLATIKNDVNVVQSFSRQWNQIMRHDFQPVLEPAVNVIQAVEDTGKLAGLERALRHIAAEAERIAEAYADMGADHAGPLFNRVMGNQASDGAYFTRPVAASIAARLTLDLCGEMDWTDPAVWKDLKTVDLACGSGTLLAAMLTDMKRRAKAGGAGSSQLMELQKLAVEEAIKGLDINPVSLQLAASQLTAGNQQIRYRSMGLHLMPYGPPQGNPIPVSVGTLELLGQNAVIPRNGELNIADRRITSQLTWKPPDDAELEDAVSAVAGSRVIIMNPPFTERVRMGEKFPKSIQESLRKRTDALEEILVKADPDLKNFASRRAVGPLFVMLAERLLDNECGLLTMLSPTILFSATSGQQERRVLAQRFHIHTVITSHQPGQINLSQNTSINESILVARRHEGPKPPTRFISLDKMPLSEEEVADFHDSLDRCTSGSIPNGWGAISFWPAERMESGNWTPAIWRSSMLAEAAAQYADTLSGLRPISSFSDITVHLTSPALLQKFEEADRTDSGSFPVLKSRGAEGQLTIQSEPDEYRVPKSGLMNTESDKLLAKAGHLLVTDGQRANTARLTATASESKYVGVGWMPVTGLSPVESQAMAVFLNSTPGRLQIMSNASRTLEFPMYRPASFGLVHVPDVKNPRVCGILAECWERTKEVQVPQFRDGSHEVRVAWDNAVAEAMNWDIQELTRLRELLSREPHVRGLGYSQYAEDVEGT